MLDSGRSLPSGIPNCNSRRAMAYLIWSSVVLSWTVTTNLTSSLPELNEKWGEEFPFRKGRYPRLDGSQVVQKLCSVNRS
jgi:hypothetical protein